MKTPVCLYERGIYILRDTYIASVYRLYQLLLNLSSQLL